jgi:hypothetical protein
MAWTAPMTAVSNSVFTAAQFNQYVRDNLNQTAPALATTTSSYFATVATNQIAERIAGQAIVSTAETTSSTSYGNLATVGPTVTVSSGVNALICMYSQVNSNTAGTVAYAGYTVSGASSISANDGRALAYATASVAATSFLLASYVHLENGLTAGSNTFQMVYRMGSGGGTGTWSNRCLTVLPF